MKTHLTILVLIIVLCAFSCKQSVPTPLSVDERSAIEDTIKQLAVIVENGANNLDIDASFDLFSDDPDFTFSEDGFILP